MQRRSLLKSLLMGGAGMTLNVTSPSLARALSAEFADASGAAAACFSELQRSLCTVLAELIIPTTDTPGAVEAGVPAFIEMMVCDWYTATERGIFLAGLEALEHDSQQTFSASYLSLPERRQIELLEKQQQLAAAYEAPENELSALVAAEDEHAPFFDKLKELVVIGYYTSEVGAKQELVYNPMPMEYRDIPFAEVGRQWSS